jgi:hypothetical protein
MGVGDDVCIGSKISEETQLVAREEMEKRKRRKKSISHIQRKERKAEEVGENDSVLLCQLRFVILSFFLCQHPPPAKNDAGFAFRFRPWYPF